MRLTIVLVSNASTFSGWENYLQPQDGGDPDGEDGSVHPDDGGQVDDAEHEDGGPQDGESAQDGFLLDDAPTDDRSDPGDRSDPPVEGGCACTTSAPAHMPMLMVLLLGLRRRRT